MLHKARVTRCYIRYADPQIRELCAAFRCRSVEELAAATAVLRRAEARGLSVCLSLPEEEPLED